MAYLLSSIKTLLASAIPNHFHESSEHLLPRRNMWSLLRWGSSHTELHDPVYLEKILRAEFESSLLKAPPPGEEHEHSTNRR